MQSLHLYTIIFGLCVHSAASLAAPGPGTPAVGAGPGPQRAGGRMRELQCTPSIPSLYQRSTPHIILKHCSALYCNR